MRRLAALTFALALLAAISFLALDAAAQTPTPSPSPSGSSGRWPVVWSRRGRRRWSSELPAERAVEGVGRVALAEGWSGASSMRTLAPSIEPYS